MDNIFILSNSPGEVAGWVKPVAAALTAKKSEAKVTLVLLPCPYASGMEERYGREIAGIDESVMFKQIWSRGAPKSGKRIVLQLGGDPFFGALLAARFRAKWMIYTARPRWCSRVDHYFLPDLKAVQRFKDKGVSAAKYSFVGNLMIDSVPICGSRSEMKARFGVPENENVVSFLPGSRPFEYQDGYAFFTKAAMALLSRVENMNAFLPVAPTVEEGLLEDGLRRAGIEWRGLSNAEEIVWNGPGRIRLIRSGNYEAIKASKLAVALPGTNNLQIASLGVPLMMVAPLNEAENIPLDGLPGIIPMSLPGAKILKKKLVFWYSSKERYVSLPNRIAGKIIVPEHRGIMTPEMVADMAEELLLSPERLKNITDGYAYIPFVRGAADKIASVVCESLERI